MATQQKQSHDDWMGRPVINRIDLRLHLTDQQFRAAVLRSKAWADYLKLPSIPHFDEPATLVEIAQRNAVRTESKLPLLDAKQELERLKADYEDRTFADRFYALASDCIAEIYGTIRPGDFDSLSGVRGFMAGKQNIVLDLIRQQSG